MLPISVLDYAPVRVGETPRDALQQTTELARRAEALGYQRFWVTEHHNVPTFASGATSVVIGHLAANTTSIRVGSGAVLLPNHSPLALAEQFGTLASLYPGRIDLGVGRATGGRGPDALILEALGRPADAREHYAKDLDDLLALFREPQAGQAMQAVPGSGLDIPVWLLGSSTVSAAHAGALGLPFSFATHIAPKVVGDALQTYRSGFKASAALARPHVMISAVIIAADTDEEAQHLCTSIRLALARLVLNEPTLLPPPVTDLASYATAEQWEIVNMRVPSIIAGSPHTVRGAVEALIAETAADELIVATFVHDTAARYRSFEIVADVCRTIRAPAKRSA